MNAAYSTTWAAINGRPLSDSYYYNAAQLRANDLPPDVYTLGKTLGSTDGAGREVRFAFTTTLKPEWSDMDQQIDVRPGYTGNYYRFYMQRALVWDNVAEMINYGTGIAFHDVKTESVEIPDSIRRHLGISQQIILKKLAGRGCKMLAEPNGNKNYLAAAESYDPIQTIYKQNGEGVVLRPYQLGDDLLRRHIIRVFDTPEKYRRDVTQQMALRPEERQAVNIGAHNTDRTWVEFLSWLNDNYGKDGADCVWMPSPEEYFEYNYLRRHARIEQRIEGDKLHISVELPGGLYFYYPSLTLNVQGLSESQCSAIEAGGTVSGLSYADCDGELMINIDCRHALEGHAEHFVELYEGYPSRANLADALYFVNMLKESGHKQALLARLK